MGDYNIPEIDWLSWNTIKSESHYSFKFLECLRDNYLEQLVHMPTRWRDQQPGSLLDLVLTDCEDNILNLETANHLGNSDHLSIEFLINCSTENYVNEVEKRNFYRADYVSANQKLLNENWDVLHNMNQQESWEYFYTVLNQIIEDCVPKVKPLHRKHKPAWMDSCCIKLTRKKKKAWKRYSHSRSWDGYYKYCAIRNKATRSIRFAKRRYEKSIAENIKVNPKSFWSFIKEKTSVKSGIGDLQNDHGQKIKDDTEKCEMLNNFFTSVFTNQQTDPPKFDIKVDNGIHEILVTKERVLKLLNGVNTSKSAGADGIHPRFIKETAETLTVPVFILFNKSLSEGSLPDIFKKANVTPIHKSGEKSLPKNYRPISVTPILCRLLETIVREVIIQHIKTNDIIINQQYGFREKRGCILQLLTVLDKLVTSLENGNPVDMIYLDIQKAFDSVPHKRLIKKIKCLGIDGNIYKWIKDFLTNRKQRVTLNGKSSKWSSVTSGVPQGSVLGPVLFILYINDLPERVKSHCVLFADDAKLYKELQHLKDFEELQEDLYELCIWASKWLLFFNVQKCKVMHIGKGNPAFEYEMKDKNENIYQLNPVTSEKDLGITFQNDMKFDIHISNVVNKANRLLGLIKRTFSYMDKTIFLTLYKTIIRPIIDYGDSVWNPSLKKHIQMIENIQRRGTKLVPDLINMSYTTRLKELNLPTLKYRRKRGDLIQVFKILNGHYDINWEDFFTLDTDRSHNTRGHSKKLVKHRTFTSLRQKSFCYRVVDQWNNLTEEIVTAKTVTSFKTLLDKHLIQQRFDTTEIY